MNMKTKIIHLLLLTCLAAHASFAQIDTIGYGEGGYWLPDSTYNFASVHPEIPIRIYGNIYSPEQDTRISGLSLITDEYGIVGHGISLVLAKYIGPDSILSDSLIQSDSPFTHSTLSYPKDVYYRIIDSARLYPNAEMTRRISLNNTEHSLCNVYDAFFDSVQTMYDSSIYILFILHYPDFHYANTHNWRNTHNWLTFIYKFHTNTPFAHADLVSFSLSLSREENSLFPLNLDSVASFYNNPHILNLHKGNFFYAIFPILDSLYDLEVHHPCHPPQKPTVTVDKRWAFFEWESNPSYCAYELAYGEANQSPTTYTSIVTTLDSCSTLSTLPGIQYACKLRALCCSADGDSTWSPWSDTVQYIRQTYTVSGYSNNIHLGYVLGSRATDIGDTVELTAVPRYDDVIFSHWSCGDTINPIKIAALQDTTVIAYFERQQDTTSHQDTTVNQDTNHVAVVHLQTEQSVDFTPNPADEYVIIRSTAPMKELDLTDLWGRKVMHIKLSATETTLRLATLPMGVYVARIHTTQGIATRKLVVCRTQSK